MPTATPPPTDPPRHQRTAGALRIDFVLPGHQVGDTLATTAAGTRLARLFQEGAARARLPRVPQGRPPEAVLINTAGGLTGGDRFQTEVRVGPGASAVVTSQASEKIYRASSGDVRITNSVSVESGGHIEWLPQETIIFDAARLDRTLHAEVAPGATALFVEATVFGRTAMGESVRTGWLRDRWRVRVGGRLVFAEALALEEDIQARLMHPTALDGGCATATVVCVRPDAARALDGVRRSLEQSAENAPKSRWVQAGASAWDGLLAVRIAAADGASLRSTLEPALMALRGGRPLPTVWHC